MPTLNWIGKEAVINHHLEVPFRLLKDVPELGCGDPGSGNLIVEGDNLVALKALLPYYKGKVKCVYIDPPYNTGNEGWVYNDNVNSPAIKKWLGETVGKEGETLDRHDRWLCMMYPRLALIREFLTEDGVLFISINDAESSALEMIGRDIFGTNNLLARLIWNTEGNTDNQLEIKINHEYVFMFLKNVNYKDEAVGYVIDPNTREDSNLWKGVADNNINKNNRANPPAIFTIPVGFPCSEKTLLYTAKKVDDSFFEVTAAEGLVSETVKHRFGIENQSGMPVKLDDLVIEDHKVTAPCRVYGGFANRRKLEQFVAGGFKPVPDNGGPISFYVNRNAAIRYRRETTASRNILSVMRNVGTTERMRTELKNMGLLFNYPKPVALLQYLLSFGCNPLDGIVMDCFAGSGTTAHAVLQHNTTDGGSRRFILVQMPQESPEHVEQGVNLARELTKERVRLVTEGYRSRKGENVEGLGGGFRYVTLGADLFDEHGRINQSNVRFADLARHVYFTETGEPLPKERISAKAPLLGIHHGRAVYLLYNGILKDKSVDGGNVLTSTTLEHLPAHDGPKVVYAAGCRFSKARLEREGITFKQTPYAIRTR